MARQLKLCSSSGAAGCARLSCQLGHPAHCHCCSVAVSLDGLQGVQGISDIITIPGLVNVDFADVKAIMQVGAVEWAEELEEEERAGAAVALGLRALGHMCTAQCSMRSSLAGQLASILCNALDVKPVEAAADDLSRQAETAVAAAASPCCLCYFCRRCPHHRTPAPRCSAWASPLARTVRRRRRW